MVITYTGHSTWSTGGGHNLHRVIQPGVQGVLIDVLHRGIKPRVQGVLIDIPTQGHTTQSTGDAHRYTYTGAHNPEYMGCS